MVHTKRLGEILVSSGLLTEDELESALEIQKNTKQRLGEILVERHFLSSSTLIVFLAQQLGIEYELDSKNILCTLSPAPKILSKLEVARYQAIVLGKQENTLIVGIADPYDYELLRELLTRLQSKVKFTLLTPKLFTQLYSEYYLDDDNVNED